jgi:hypothetical protein
MQTLGQRLEEARKRKGISIREAAEATKIRGDYLQKFEASSFDFDLPPLYVRGFVRAYARHLDLDAPRIVAEFDQLMADSGRAPRREARENFGRVDFGGEAEGAAPRPAGGGGLDPVLLKYLVFGGGAVVVLLLVLIAVNVFSDGAPARPAPKTGAAESAPPPRAVEPPAPSAQVVTLTALDNTRVKIVRVADESVLFDGALARGESRSIQKIGVLRVTVEDRTKLRIEVNGRAMDIPVLQGGNYGRFTLD